MQICILVFLIHLFYFRKIFLFCSKIVNVCKDGIIYVSVEVNDIIVLDMNEDGILSDKLKKMESVKRNGQLGDDDIIIIDSQSDDHKVGAKTYIRDDLYEEHKEPVMDNNVNKETSITDDNSEADSYESFLPESDNEQASAYDEDTEVCESNTLTISWVAYLSFLKCCWVLVRSDTFNKGNNIM